MQIVVALKKIEDRKLLRKLRDPANKGRTFLLPATVAVTLGTKARRGRTVSVFDQYEIFK